MKTLCKKTLIEHGIISSEWYDTSNIYKNDNSFITVRNTTFITRNGFMENKKDGTTSLRYNEYWKDMIFENYFYTNNEIRKLKLNKINESTL